MSKLAFLKDENWDLPFFKRLARNDTANAPGHQAGILIPQSIRPFFPTLVGTPSATQPTVDHYLTAVLMIGGTIVDRVVTRYQFQTWHGTRRPEARLTGQLGAIRSVARGGDYLVIQRSIDNLNLYRLSLIRQDSVLCTPFAKLVLNRRWGPVENERPVTQADVEAVEATLATQVRTPFQVFDTAARVTEQRTRRLARSIVFQRTIRTIYRNACSVCGMGLQSPLGLLEIDAAHIIPRQQRGSDDPRNGLALCKRDHWAFDQGLFAVDSSRKILVPWRIRRLVANKPLHELHGQPLTEATDPQLSASDEALKWHRKNVLIQNDY